MNPRRKQAGSAAIEFALVLLLFLTFLFGIIDVTRWLYTWNAAAEVTRAGARYAVVCDDTQNEPAVLARMQALLPQITDIDLEWVPANCNAASCEGVTVSINGFNFQWVSPIAGVASLAAIPLPRFSTHLTREVMRQDPNSAELCL